MSKEPKETAVERLARMKREKEAAQGSQQETQGSDLVGQLTHVTDGSPDFSDLADKLEQRKALEAKGENEGHTKMTIYVRDDIYRSFNALITKRGQQKLFINQALQDFVQKKARELGL